MRKDPNQPDSFREDSHFVRVGDGRPARHEIRQETKDRVRGTQQLGLGVVFHCPFETVASQRQTHPGMLVFNADKIVGLRFDVTYRIRLAAVQLNDVY